MRHLLQESDLAHQRRKVRRLQASVLTVSLTGLLAFILLCILTRTGNASLMLKLGWICLILSGWSAIALSVCGLKPAKARLTHWEGLLRGEPVLREGVFRMTEERFRIPRSVAVRRVLLRSGDEELRLNRDEDWVSLAPPDGSSVRLLTALLSSLTRYHLIPAASGIQQPTRSLTRTASAEIWAALKKHIRKS